MRKSALQRALLYVLLIAAVLVLLFTIGSNEPSSPSPQSKSSPPTAPPSQFKTNSKRELLRCHRLLPPYEATIYNRLLPRTRQKLDLLTVSAPRQQEDEIAFGCVLEKAALTKLAEYRPWERDIMADEVIAQILQNPLAYYHL